MNIPPSYSCRLVQKESTLVRGLPTRRVSNNSCLFTYIIPLLIHISIQNPFILTSLPGLHIRSVLRPACRSLSGLHPPKSIHPSISIIVVCGSVSVGTLDGEKGGRWRRRWPRLAVYPVADTWTGPNARPPANVAELRIEMRRLNDKFEQVLRFMRLVHPEFALHEISDDDMHRGESAEALPDVPNVQEHVVEVHRHSPEQRSNAAALNIERAIEVEVERRIPVHSMRSFNDLEVALKDDADLPRKFIAFLMQQDVAGPIERKEMAHH
jgi:hypothetical protein